GPRDGSPVLFVHGLGDWSGSYQAIATHPLLAAHRIYVPDLPGYGDSPPWPTPLSLDEIVAALARWWQDEVAVPVTLVGHSMGGVLVQLLAESHPHCAAAVINVEGNVSRDDCFLSGKVAAQPLSEFVGGGFAAMCSHFNSISSQSTSIKAYCEGLARARPESYHLHSGELLLLSMTEELAPRLAALPMPKVYIAGAPGGTGPRSLGLLRQAEIEVTTLSPAGHFPILDCPDEFAACLLSFTNTTRSSRS
ncbi:MAG: alpha/beta hydrolase, partial [Proteobacteria bacterium]|nr:alpha/beta hydrolase [Pseudomonadota bacterium]